MKKRITLTVNNRDHILEVQTHHTLLWVLRDHLKLFGVREGCGVGMCGACTVLLDGKPVSSCLLFAQQAQGKAIETVEGMAEAGELHPIQQAFLDATGYQCSFCTPGFLLTTKSLLAEHPNADDEEIRDYLAGNLCRCGSYVKIMDAVKLAQGRMQ